MLTEEKKAEIRNLKREGLKISEIARQVSVDWKTVQKIIAQSQGHKKEDPAQGDGINDSEVEPDLSKTIFKKLNSGESPVEIISEIGHVKLVIDSYEKWRMLRGHTPENLPRPDPKICRNFYAWLESVEEYPEWHEKMAHKFLAGFAWMRLGGCPNYKKQGVECPQTEESNPYECLACGFYSEGDSFTTKLNF